MSDELRTLIDQSRQELQLKTEAHCAWGLDRARWDVDQTQGEIVFTTDDVRAVAPVQIIGTFNSEDNSWMWSWNNLSIREPLTEHARTLQRYGEEHGVTRLTDGQWSGTEEDAWDMAALAMKLNDAQCAYRGPAGATQVFMTFGAVALSKP